MDGDKLRTRSGGVSQSGLRAHNERVLLSLIRREGPLPGSELAKRTQLSPQTVSVILRSLETEGFLQRGDPQRGKVGKPSVPIDLNPSGAFSFGVKIGRRSAELALIDFTGALRDYLRLPYGFPEPRAIERFVLDGMAQISGRLAAQDQSRITGIGIAIPHRIWDWHESISAPARALDAWRSFDLAARLTEATGLATQSVNDATAACRAEHVYGKGRAFQDYAYFYIGAFIGGGIVLDGAVVEGRRGNAAAFGPLNAGQGKKLIDTASLVLLEEALRKNGKDSARLWKSPPDWSGIDAELDEWCRITGAELACACLQVFAVLDLDVVLVDGAFPDTVRDSVVLHAQETLETLDKRWLLDPRIEAGSSGSNARVIGAACGPIFSEFF